MLLVTASDVAGAGAPGGRRGAGLRVAIGIVLALGAAWLAWHFVLAWGLQRLHEGARQRLEVEATRLDAQLSRFDYLPSLLETSPAVLDLLERPDDALLVDQVNRHLKALNAIAGTDNLYVLDGDGRVRAAADFDDPGTPVGQELSYRPYFRDARAQGRGRFYGVGITSARAGYYLAYALKSAAGRPGVATVKVNLDAIEREWRELPYELLLADEHQVVILASRDAWRFHPLEPLSVESMAESNRARRYGATMLPPLNWRLRESIADQAQRVSVDGLPYLASGHAVNGARWRLVLLEDERPVVLAAAGAAVIAALATTVLLLILALVVQRKRALRQRLASREALQAAHDSLERKVEERTAELRAAQSELVHAETLAVLGQMSASMVHELNQPLAALHTLSDNAALLIERNRHDEARSNLARIGQLVSRLGRLTGQLKVFAHKSGHAVGPVLVQRVVTEALALLAPRLRAAAIEVVVVIEPPDLTVLGEATRLEQVLINLLGNAIDALDGATGTRRIELRGSPADGGAMADGGAGGAAEPSQQQPPGAWAEIAVLNTGPPIDSAILARLFEPFVTSKPAGRGLGLGLLISSHIVRSFGGALAASNLEPTGVACLVRLPRVLAQGRSPSAASSPLAAPSLPASPFPSSQPGQP